MPNDEELQRGNDAPKGFVPMREAALTAAFKCGMTGPLSGRNLDAMAEMVAGLCTLFVASSDGTIRALSREDVRGGRFMDGAKRVSFHDGRATLEPLFVTSTALRAALALMTRTRP
jgi:hypothetical protein